MAKLKERSLYDRIKSGVGYITTLGVISGIGYSVGRWQSDIEYKTTIMEIRQDYNVEIANIKIEYNNRLLELQNELKIMELSNND